MWVQQKIEMRGIVQPHYTNNDQRMQTDVFSKKINLQDDLQQPLNQNKIIERDIKNRNDFYKSSNRFLDQDKNSTDVLKRYLQFKEDKIGVSDKNQFKQEDEYKKKEPERVIKSRNISKHYKKSTKKIYRKELYSMIWFVCCYLLGSVLAGIAYYQLNQQIQSYLSYYIKHIILLIEKSQFLDIFFQSFIAFFSYLSVVLILGMSVCGIPLLVIFWLLQGVGNGVLCLTVFTSYPLQRALYYIAILAVGELFLMSIVCLFSTLAYQTSKLLFQYVFYSMAEEKQQLIPSLFFKYIVCVLVVFVICGTWSAIVCIVRTSGVFL